MARLNISVKYDDLGVNTALDKQLAVLQIQTLTVGVGSLGISNDPNNALKTGSDGGVLLDSADSLSTTYNYADSVTTMWSI